MGICIMKQIGYRKICMQIISGQHFVFDIIILMYIMIGIDHFSRRKFYTSFAHFHSFLYSPHIYIKYSFFNSKLGRILLRKENFRWRVFVSAHGEEANLINNCFSYKPQDHAASEMGYGKWKLSGCPNVTQKKHKFSLSS